MSVVSLRDVSKRFGDVTALDRVSFDVEEDMIYGFLGRNGAGKSTTMQILTGQGFASSGQVRVFGEHPYENENVLSRVCLVKENQRYPDPFKVRHVLRAGRELYPEWDQPYAESLLDDFELSGNRVVRKLSRGMLSALGVVVGLASRAPLTFFDEPYLGLDPVARQLFYDRLLEDYAKHPRTIVLSTHLIDEISDLVEHVVLIDAGGVLIDESAETLRQRAMTVTGAAPAVDEFTEPYEEFHREQLGSFARVTVSGTLGDAERASAQALGLSVEPVSLQQLMIHTTAGRVQAGHTAPDTATHTTAKETDR